MVLDCLAPKKAVPASAANRLLTEYVLGSFLKFVFCLLRSTPGFLFHSLELLTTLFVPSSQSRKLASLSSMANGNSSSWENSLNGTSGWIGGGGGNRSTGSHKPMGQSTDGNTRDETHAL